MLVHYERDEARLAPGVRLIDAASDESGVGWLPPCGRPAAVFAEVVSAQWVAVCPRHAGCRRRAGVRYAHACASAQASVAVVAAGRDRTARTCGPPTKNLAGGRHGAKLVSGEAHDKEVRHRDLTARPRVTYEFPDGN